MTQASLIGRVLEGGDPTLIVSSLVEVAAHRQRVATLATVEQWKKDLRKLTKIYRSMDSSPWDYGYPENKRERDQKHELAKFTEAHKIYVKFKENFKKWALMGLLGMPSIEGVRAGHEYWQRQTSEMEAVNKAVHAALWPMDHDLFPYRTDTVSFDPPEFKSLPEPWKLTKREKDKQVRRYQRPFNHAFKVVSEFIKRRQSVELRTPKTATMDIAGFHVIIEKPYKQDASYIEQDIQDTVTTLKKALPILRRRATKAYPRLVKLKLPLIYDADFNLDQAATYDQFKRVIKLKACGVHRKNPIETVAVLAHEMSHEVWKHVLSNEARSYWTRAIESDYSKIDLDRIRKLWTDPEESLLTFTYRVKNSHPDLHIQLMAYAAGFAGSEGTRINTRKDFFDKAGSLFVMKTPITPYAHKNPEEAFCEAVSTLVTYGSRALYPVVRAWLRTVLPEIRTESMEPSSLVEAVRSGNSPADIVASLVESSLVEGRYDKATTDISRWIVNFLKEKLKAGGIKDVKEVELPEKLSATLPHVAAITLSVIVDDEGGIDTAGVYDVANTGRMLMKEYATIRLKVKLPPTFPAVRPGGKPTYWNHLISKLKNTIRHELEHSAQSDELLQAVPLPRKYRRGEEVDLPYREWVNWYYTRPSEVGAFIAGMYKEAKTRKMPLRTVIKQKIGRIQELLRQSGLKIAARTLGAKLQALWIDHAVSRYPEAMAIDDVHPKRQKRIAKIKRRAKRRASESIESVLAGGGVTNVVASLVEVKGIIRKAPDRPGTKWALPFTLFKQGFSGWQVVGRYKTERAAHQAAKRRDIKIVKESLNERTLYHGTLRDHEKSIMKIGLVPDDGAFVSAMYGAYQDKSFSSQGGGAVFAADKKGLDNAVGAMRFHIAQKLGGQDKDIYLTDIGIPEIEKHGMLAVMKEVELGDLYGDPDEWRRHPGYEKLKWDVPEMPQSVEPGDYFLTNEQGIGVDHVLTGKKLVQFLRRNGGLKNIEADQRRELIKLMIQRTNPTPAERRRIIKTVLGTKKHDLYKYLRAERKAAGISEGSITANDPKELSQSPFKGESVEGIVASVLDESKTDRVLDKARWYMVQSGRGTRYYERADKQMQVRIDLADGVYTAEVRDRGSGKQSFDSVKGKKLAVGDWEAAHTKALQFIKDNAVPFDVGGIKVGSRVEFEYTTDAGWDKATGTVVDISPKGYSYTFLIKPDKGGRKRRADRGRVRKLKQQ